MHMVGAMLFFTLIGNTELYYIEWHDCKAWSMTGREHACICQLLYLVPAELCHDSFWRCV